MKKILVVDDDRTTRALVQGLLKQAGHEVTTAADGTEGLATIENNNFDLVLLDVWMPGMTGLDVLHQMGKILNAPPAIVMTTDDTPETLLRAVREQAYDFVHKPVEPAVLQSLVTSVLERKRDKLHIEVISSRPNWVELLVPCEMETAHRIQSFMKHLKGGLPDKVREAVGQAFHELLLNAIEWGGKLDATRKVRIAYVRTPRMLMYRIADPGKGFKFEDLKHSALSNPESDPFQHTDEREKQGLRPGGFGLLMTGSMVDELVYNERQNEVMFVKYLTEEKTERAAAK